MRTILYTIDTTGPGGAETIFVEIASKLNKDKYRPVVAIAGPGWVHDALRSRGLQPYFIDAKGGFSVRYLAQLIRIIRKHRVDIIHSHLLGSNVYSSLAGLFTGTPVVSTFHGYIDFHDTEKYLSLKLRLIRLRSKKIVFVSNSLRDRLLASLPLESTQAVTIYNGIDPEEFTCKRNDLLRGEFGFAPTDVVIGAIGNIRRTKGYEVLLQAAASLARKSPRYKFLIVGQGSGQLLEELTELRSRLSLERSVVLAGYRHDIPIIINGLDFFVLSSISEGFSLSTIEAMSCGLPVVATRSGGPEEIITDGHDGLLVEPGSPGELAAAIERLVGDPELQVRLSRNAVQTVKNHFTIDVMLESYDRLYDQTIGAV